jgi:hypothetical protein
MKKFKPILDPNLTGSVDQFLRQEATLKPFGKKGKNILEKINKIKPKTIKMSGVFRENIEKKSIKNLQKLVSNLRLKVMALEILVNDFEATVLEITSKNTLPDED